MSYGQFCASARALEVVGERWTLLIVRELLSGSTAYNEIRRGLPKIPRDTLSKRLRLLETAGVVTRRLNGATPVYQLTDAGVALQPVIVALADWGMEWDRRGLLPEHLEPDALLWDIHRRVAVDRTPPGRITTQFVLEDRSASDRTIYLVLNDGDAELCRTDGGYPVDLVISAETETVAQWWLGEASWTSALKSRLITIQGPPELRRSFPTWFLGYALNSSPKHMTDR